MTEFERITQSPETLGAFLASLSCIEGPWDVEFQKRFCSGCARADCDGAEPCPHAAERSNPGWWLTLEAGDDQAAMEPPEIKIVRPWGESGCICGAPCGCYDG